MAMSAGPDRPASPDGPAHPRRRLLGTWRRQVVAAVVIVGALAYLLFQGLTNATVYFKTADQAVADRASLGTKPFRIEGTVLDDVRKDGATTTFSIFQNGATVRVIDTAQPSQLFKPGIPVVLEGRWQGAAYAADQIMVKHTASYTEAHPGRLRPQTPASPAPAPTP